MRLRAGGGVGEPRGPEARPPAADTDHVPGWSLSHSPPGPQYPSSTRSDASSFSYQIRRSCCREYRLSINVTRQSEANETEWWMFVATWMEDLYRFLLAGSLPWGLTMEPKRENFPAADWDKKMR